MKISIGSDHGGYALKNVIKAHLLKQGIDVIDVGCFSEESVHYPIYAKKVAYAVKNSEVDFGILICTTGIGMSICANKVKGIRAALVSNEDAASLTRRHNDSNVLCLSQKYTSSEVALKIVDIFLSEQFEGGRHLERVNLIKNLEE